jgi:hypothetical protein
VTDYPSGLPAPSVEGYSVDTQYGISAIAFERGNTRQRRGAKRERHVSSLSMVLSISELWQWQSWANRYGYDWHYMDLASSYSGATSDVLVPHYVRYIGDISVQQLSPTHVRVAVQAELNVSVLPLAAEELPADWIIAGTPASPSTDTITAGTPASPSTDTIIAGPTGLTA